MPHTIFYLKQKFNLLTFSKRFCNLHLHSSPPELLKLCGLIFEKLKNLGHLLQFYTLNSQAFFSWCSDQPTLIGFKT